jgi:hypothetical protein
MGFRVQRRLSQCKILNILPTPLTEKEGDADARDHLQRVSIKVVRADLKPQPGQA